MPEFQLRASNGYLELNIAIDWYQQQSVLAADLLSEQQFIRRLGLTLDCPGLSALQDD